MIWFSLFLLSLGSPSDLNHLGDVPFYLYKMEDRLQHLKGFWENLYSLLNTIRDTTFLKEHLVDKPDCKEEFLDSVQKASEVSGVYQYARKATLDSHCAGVYIKEAFLDTISSN